MVCYTTAMAWMEAGLNAFNNSIDPSKEQRDPIGARRDALSRLDLKTTLVLPIADRPIYPTLSPEEFREYLNNYDVPQDVRFLVSETYDGGTEIIQRFVMAGCSTRPSVDKIDQPDSADRVPATHIVVAKYDENNLLRNVRVFQEDSHHLRDVIPTYIDEWEYSDLIKTDTAGNTLAKPYYLLKEAKSSVINDEGKKVVNLRTVFNDDGTVIRDRQATKPDEISLDEAIINAINTITPYKGEPVVFADDAIAMLRDYSKKDMKGIIFVEDIEPGIVQVRIHEMLSGPQTRLTILTNDGFGFLPRKFNRMYIPVSPNYENWLEYRDRGERPVLNIFQTDPSDPSKYGDRLVDE